MKNNPENVGLALAEISPEHISIYEEAFPPEERRPREAMRPADKAFRFYNISSSRRSVAGLLTAWDFGTFTYIEHFAVDPSLRGGGIGASALECLSCPLLIEVEPPETGDTARRRIAFYLRQGFRLLDYPYIQPPYAPELPSVELRLMVRGDIGIAVAEAVRLLHTRVYGQKE